MTMSIIICDDSTVARNQMRAALPDDWDVEVSLAHHGGEAMDLLREGKGEVLFLDLNMPVLDGYQTLEAIRSESLSSIVIVVSGDVQPEAHRRVMSLGALAFIEKPAAPLDLVDLLNTYGLYSAPTSSTIEPETPVSVPETPQVTSIDGIGRVAEIPANLLRDGMQEVANVAMGRSADLLARLLKVFVKLPIPNVNLLEVNELKMALSLASEGATYSAVCQGFIGAGIAGEALLIFDDSSFSDIAQLMQRSEANTREAELELLMDLSSILTGSCISGVGQQLDVHFSLGHPMVLGQHVSIEHLVGDNTHRWSQTLAIEITYHIENYNITCDLLLLFTEDSIGDIEQRLAYLFN